MSPSYVQVIIWRVGTLGRSEVFDLGRSMVESIGVLEDCDLAGILPISAIRLNVSSRCGIELGSFIDERCWLWLQRYRIADSYASNVLIEFKHVQTADSEMPVAAEVGGLLGFKVACMGVTG